MLAVARLNSLTYDSSFVSFNNNLVEECYDFCMLKKKERREKPWTLYNEDVKKKGHGPPKKKVLQMHHVQYLFEYLESCEKEYPTIKQMGEQLLSTFDDLFYVSASTIRRIVNNTLKFSFKQLKPVMPNKLQPNVKESQTYASLILAKAILNDMDIICIDETALHENYHLKRGWSFRGTKKLIMIPPRTKRTSLCAAISLNGVLAAHLLDGSFN